MGSGSADELIKRMRSTNFKNELCREFKAYYSNSEFNV